MAGVILQNVSKTFAGDVVAVQNANLEVNDSEFMVIVGPSGCGKTTMLRLIAGLEEVTEGTIRIGDRTVNDVSPRDRDVAMVFQNYALYPHMTVFDNMAFALKLRKSPKAEIKAKVQQAAELLGIEKLLNRKPKALSGGQQQRVAVGRAMVRNPQVFLFDEPLSNLDAKLRITTRAELKALHRKLQTTTIYVTHDQVEAMTMGDRICVLHNGLIQQIAEPMEVYDKPVNRFIAGFLGTSPMNFIEGRLIDTDGNPGFIAGDVQISLPDSMRVNLSPYVTQEVVLGIRPEHLFVKPFKGRACSIIHTTVSLNEPLGDRMNLHLTCPSGNKLIANVGSHVRLRPTDSVTTYIDIERVHIFKPGETGENISLNI
jgi:multiple sugar transport system ATP-binding protein